MIIERFPEIEDVGIFKLDSTKVKKKILQQPGDILNKIKKELPEIISERIFYLKEWFSK